MTKKILHILCVEPDDTLQQFIESISGDNGVNVVCLYNDGIAKAPVRLLSLEFRRQHRLPVSLS